jgi:hypothetical protein
MALKRKPGFEECSAAVALGKRASAPAALKQESPEQVKPPPCLKIATRGNGNWAFPWDIYCGVHVMEAAESGDNGEKIDRITLHYTHCKVILKGINLGQYEKAIHDETLEKLQMVDSDLEKILLSRKEPVIRSVEVKMPPE